MGSKRQVVSEDHSDPTDLGHNAKARLRSLIERVERLVEDRDAVNADIKEVMAEAKGEGFDTKIMRKVIALRRQDAAKRQEEEALIDLYLSALDLL